MRHTLTVERAVPWPHFNEYEGQIEGRLDGHPVTCHVFITDGDWTRIRPGATYEVQAKLVRDGEVQVLDASGLPALSQRDGVSYEVVGTVVARDGEDVRLDTILPLDVDLDLAPFPRRTVPDVAVGDRIRVEGTLEAELDLDD
jgi:hypothetical protein